MSRLWIVIVAVGMGVIGGCASSPKQADDGPARAMARLKEPVRAAAEGYVGAIEELARVLTGVTDTPGARGAMPKVEEVLAKLAEHRGTLDGAGASAKAEARYAFWMSLDAANASLDAQVNRIKGTPGVGPALSGLLDKVPRWR